MDMGGEVRIPAEREKVWAALNDADVLKACIPGCKTLDKQSDTEMTATVVSKIGPVKATFKGSVTLEDIVAPESYKIVGEGKGGVAGFAKGSAAVKLTEDGAETVLTYEAKAQVGGKLAQLGSRLIDSTARKMADEFFSTFSKEVGGAAAVELDEGLMEEAKSLAAEHAPETVAESVSEAVHEAEHKIEEAVHSAEETVQKVVHTAEAEVETAAAKGALGGPVVWGLIALGVLILGLAVLG